MLRQVLVAIGAAWLTVASVWSPFAHIHPTDPGHHHDNGFAHPHFAHARQHEDHTEGPEVEADDHDPVAVWTDWAPTVEPRFDLPVAELAARVEIFEPSLTEGVAPQFTVRSHDPPYLLRSSDRAPPL